jgi:2-polyprenyl-3-methyl-5-hydroxy-6-metoxy-1,4-benzoquinol methylase
MRLEIFDEVRPRGLFRRWLARRDAATIVRLVTPRPAERALDVGCGDGGHCALLKGMGLWVGAVDLSPAAIERVRPRVDEARVADLQLLDLGQQYDIVLCFGVLEYVGDWMNAMWNLAAHVRDGGRLLVEIPQRSLAGRAYALGYGLRYATRPRLLDCRELDDVARGAGLRLIGRARSFWHGAVLAWRRDAS